MNSAQDDGVLRKEIFESEKAEKEKAQEGET